MELLPITPEQLLTLSGMALVAGLLTQWIKQFFREDTPEDPHPYRQLIINGLCLAFSLAIALAVQFVVAQGQPSAQEITSAALVAFLGASLATLGYESVTNLAKGLKGEVSG